MGLLKSFTIYLLLFLCNSEVDIRNQGKIYFDEINTQKENSYTTANIKAGYLFDDWDIYAYANNITDESYLTAVNGTTVIFGEGRFVGIGVKYIF